jgi:hypothetical protein
MIFNLLKKFIHLTLIYCMIAIPTHQSALAMWNGDEEGSDEEKGGRGSVSSTAKLKQDASSSDEGSPTLQRKDKGKDKQRMSEGTGLLMEEDEVLVPRGSDLEEGRLRLKLVPKKDAQRLSALRGYFDGTRYYTDGDFLAFGGYIVEPRAEGAGMVGSWTDVYVFPKASDMGFLQGAIQPFRCGRLSWQLVGSGFSLAAIVGYTNIVSGATFNTLQIPLDGGGEIGALIGVMAMELPLLLRDGWELGGRVHKFLVGTVGQERTICGKSCTPLCCIVNRGPYKSLGFVVGESQDDHPWYFQVSRKEKVAKVIAVVSGVIRASLPIALFLDQAMKGPVTAGTIVLAVTMGPPLLNMYVSSALRTMTRLFQPYNWGKGNSAYKRRLMIGRSERLKKKILKNDRRSVHFVNTLFELLVDQVDKRMQEHRDSPILENDLLDGIIEEFNSSVNRLEEVKKAINSELVHGIKPGAAALDTDYNVRRFLKKGLKKISSDGSFYLKRIGFLKGVLERIRDEKTKFSDESDPDDFVHDDLVDAVPEQIIPVISLLMLKSAELNLTIPDDPKLHLDRQADDFILDLERDDRHIQAHEGSHLLEGSSRELVLAADMERLQRENEELQTEADRLNTREMVRQRDMDAGEFKEEGAWATVSYGVAAIVGFGGLVMETFVFKWALGLFLNSVLGSHMSSQEIGIASECIGAVVAISASLDFEDVRRGVYKMKTFFTRDGDFWPARRLATVYSFGFAFLLSFIEIAIGLEELPNAISDPVFNIRS